MTQEQRNRDADLVRAFIKTGEEIGATDEEGAMACMILIDQAREEGVEVLGEKIPEVEE